jgi:hypothetical protein
MKRTKGERGSLSPRRYRPQYGDRAHREYDSGEHYGCSYRSVQQVADRTGGTAPPAHGCSPTDRASPPLRIPWRGRRCRESVPPTSLRSLATNSVSAVRICPTTPMIAAGLTDQYIATACGSSRSACLGHPDRGSGSGLTIHSLGQQAGGSTDRLSELVTAVGVVPLLPSHLDIRRPVGHAVPTVSPTTRILNVTALLIIMTLCSQGVAVTLMKRLSRRAMILSRSGAARSRADQHAAGQARRSVLAGNAAWWAGLAVGRRTKWGLPAVIAQLGILSVTGLALGACGGSTTQADTCIGDWYQILSPINSGSPTYDVYVVYTDPMGQAACDADLKLAGTQETQTSGFSLALTIIPSLPSGLARVCAGKGEAEGFGLLGLPNYSVIYTVPGGASVAKGNCGPWNGS